MMLLTHAESVAHCKATNAFFFFLCIGEQPAYRTTVWTYNYCLEPTWCRRLLFYTLSHSARPFSILMVSLNPYYFPIELLIKCCSSIMDSLWSWFFLILLLLTQCFSDHTSGFSRWVLILTLYSKVLAVLPIFWKCSYLHI